MKSILISLFVFTLGSLAANIPTDEIHNDIQDVSAESSEKRSSDPALSSSVRITKRGVGHHKSGLTIFSDERIKAKISVVSSTNQFDTK